MIAGCDAVAPGYTKVNDAHLGPAPAAPGARRAVQLSRLGGAMDRRRSRHVHPRDVPAGITTRAAAARLAALVRGHDSLRGDVARVIATVAVRRAGADPLDPRAATDPLARALAEAAGEPWRDAGIRRRCRALAHVAVLAALRIAGLPDGIGDPELHALSLAAAVCARTVTPPAPVALDDAPAAPPVAPDDEARPRRGRRRAA